MASRIISFFRLFPSGQIKTAPANSWATVALWRRFFELQEDEAEKQAEEVLSAVDDVLMIHQERTVESEEARNARKQFLVEHYRNLIKEQKSDGSGSAANGRTAHRIVDDRIRQLEDQQIQQPNLDIPLDDSYVTLAQ